MERNLGTSFLLSTLLWACGGGAVPTDGSLSDGGPGPLDAGGPEEDVSPWSAASAGDSFSLGVREDGSLWAWGSPAGGVLGNGCAFLGDLPCIRRRSPVQVGTGSTWVAVAAGANHALAIQSDGTLWAWGENSAGELGLGACTGPCPVQTMPVRSGTASDWLEVHAGIVFSIGLRADRTLWRTGARLRCGAPCGSPGDYAFDWEQVGTDTWRALSAGARHALMVRSDGTLWAVGYDDAGQLGDGLITFIGASGTDVPMQIGADTDWVAVAAGGAFSLALKADGSLWHWGTYDQPRAPPQCPSDACLVPRRLGTRADWVAIGAGHSTGYAVDRDGVAWAWGRGDFGQLGDGCTDCSTTSQFVVDPRPIPAPAAGWTSIVGSVTRLHALGFATDAGATHLYGWGANPDGMTGIGTTDNPITTPTRIVAR